MSSNSPSLGDRRKSIGGLFNRSASNLLLPNSARAGPSKTTEKKSTARRLSAAISPITSSSNRAENDVPFIITKSTTPSGSRPVSTVLSSSPMDSDSPRSSSRPSFGKRNRPSSIFDSLRSLKYGEDEDTPPLTANSSSSRAQSFTWREFGGDIVDVGKNRIILHHGEAQTSSGWFWKKKEYLVLTESHLIRYKNRSKANESFPAIPPVASRSELLRHSSSQSVDSIHDQQSLYSDVSGEKAAGIPLEWIVAIFLPDESRLLHALEVCYLDTETVQNSSITLSFGDPDERDVWLRSLGKAANNARLLDPDPIPVKLAEHLSRAVERDQDYDPENIQIYKVVKRAGPRRSGKSSADESAKISPTVLFLVIGINKVHLVPLPKNVQRVSSTALNELIDDGSFGVLTLTWISIASRDDSFSLAFRSPFHSPKSFSLASLAAPEIAVQLHLRDSYLRPQWIRQPFAFSLPLSGDDFMLPDPDLQSEDLDCFDRTLTGFCVAYGVNPYYIRYSVNDSVDDGPLFELLPPTNRQQQQYSALEILAVLRSLRFNEYFKSLSFSGVNLDVLNGLRDHHDLENLCTRARSGTPVRVPLEEQETSSLLITEIRAVAISSRTLRRLDFSHCLPNISRVRSGVTSPSSGCEILEAMYPICRDQNTNVDWICLNGLPLAEVDIDFLVSMAALRTCHLRAIEISECGLREDSLSLLFDSLKAQSETLESIDISYNPSRLLPSDLISHLDAFDYVSNLNLSGLILNCGHESFLPLDLLSKWRLGGLKLSGLSLNEEGVKTLCKYVASPNAESLRQLNLAKCSLTGKHVSELMRSLKVDAGTARLLHLDLSENNLQQGHKSMVRAISQNLAPTHLSMRSIEYDDDHLFAALISALAHNKSIRYLDISQVSLPGQPSSETCMALEELFSRNNTIEDLDISGEDSRLEFTKFGNGFIQALRGLQKNNTMQCLKVRHQKLGLQGASALADVLRENNTLKYLHCECNAITLTGFTDLVNALAFNRSLLYLPSQEDSRDKALHQTAAQIRLAQEKADSNIMTPQNKLSGVRRTIAKIGTGEASIGRVAPVPRWSDQDVQAALRLVDEGWEEQLIRLQAFLDRNNKLAAGIALDKSDDVFDEELQRPYNTQSIARVMEQVMNDSTPTIEKEVELGKPDSGPNSSDASSLNEGLSIHQAPLSNKLSSARPPLFPTVLGDIEIDTTPMFEQGDPFELVIPKSQMQRPPPPEDLGDDRIAALWSFPADIESSIGRPSIELKLPSPGSKKQNR